ncbi:hypothetical protein SUGI_1229200 [Cryptomeria japonica]|uniref:Uncharacterized protein n=1 Tax=Cryptomeria japonica TaxID=3369 RepID=A0AAD3RMI6_CRYJA|nr:hypothetical protein SUGI_1229200 [Cryptomeria japonica]
MGGKKLYVGMKVTLDDPRHQSHRVAAGARAGDETETATGAGTAAVDNPFCWLLCSVGNQHCSANRKVGRMGAPPDEVGRQVVQGGMGTDLDHNERGAKQGSHRS